MLLQWRHTASHWQLPAATPADPTGTPASGWKDIINGGVEGQGAAHRALIKK